MTDRCKRDNGGTKAARHADKLLTLGPEELIFLSLPLEGLPRAAWVE